MGLNANILQYSQPIGKLQTRFPNNKELKLRSPLITQFPSNAELKWRQLSYNVVLLQPCFSFNNIPQGPTA